MMGGFRHLVTSATLNGARFVSCLSGHTTTNGAFCSVKKSAATVKIAAPVLSRVLPPRGRPGVPSLRRGQLAAHACSALALAWAASFWGEA